MRSCSDVCAPVIGQYVWIKHCIQLFSHLCHCLYESCRLVFCVQRRTDDYGWQYLQRHSDISARATPIRLQVDVVELREGGLQSLRFVIWLRQSIMVFWSACRHASNGCGTWLALLYCVVCIYIIGLLRIILLLTLTHNHTYIHVTQQLRMLIKDQSQCIF